MGFEYGSYPHLPEMNPAFRVGAHALKLTLEIDWRPEDPETELARVQRRLASFSPSLRRHQCRGPHPYRLFRTADGSGAADADDVEPSLALAHVAEHLLIDVIARVTQARRISGATGALKEPAGNFDVFVECPDPIVARLGVHLVFSFILDDDGDRSHESARRLLRLGRRLYAIRPRSVCVERVAGEFGGNPEQSEEDFLALEESGFACQVPSTMNFSGLSYYRVCN